MSRILETTLERLNRLRENMFFHYLRVDSTDGIDPDSTTLLYYKDYVFLDNLARQSTELKAENDHLRYRLNDGIWNDFKKSQEIWAIERRVLISQIVELKKENETLKKRNNEV